MADSALVKRKTRTRAVWFYPICVLLAVVLFVADPGKSGGYGWLYLGGGALLLFALRPNSALYAASVCKMTPVKAYLAYLAALFTIAACILPMNRLPIWNGEIPDHRNQYELMAEAILDGRVDFAYGDEDQLAGLENPYSPQERDAAGVTYHWDHAYYNGHYYMYFGIVPVLLVFLPYRVLTGTSLTTYHATQLFVALSIAGIFALFYLLTKLFFKKLPFTMYLLLSVAVSAMSVWYSTAEPALYCTAITSALALEIWSLYFFVRAVFSEQRENRQILLAGIGAALGALAFGCRPPVALANILVVPLLVVFLRAHKCSARLFGKLFLAASPYFIVAAGLMWYNYIRFGNPFEFGQAYQLTVADQSDYKITLNAQTLRRIFVNSYSFFFEIGEVQSDFPYFRTSSVLWNFPILLLSLAMCSPSVLKAIKKEKMLAWTVCLFLTAFVITAADILWTPYLLERYRMDIYFLLGIACFVILGFWWNTCREKSRKYLESLVSVLSGFTVVCAVLFCVYTIGLYYPEKITEIGAAWHLL